MRGIGIRTRAALPWLGILAFWAAIHALIAGTVMARVFEGQLIDTDGYMRLVRVAELVASGGWYDSTIERFNAPFGSVLHWTRPFDVLLLAIEAIVRPFAASFDQALLVAGIVVSPLTAAGTCLLMAWAARPLLGQATAYMAAILILLQPGVTSYTMAGRADHHALQFLLVVLALGFTLRLLTRPPERKLAFAAGVAYAAGVWVSVEMLLLAGLYIGALALHWIAGPDAADRRPRALLQSTGMFTAASAIILLVERGPADLLAVEYDRISIVQVAIPAVTFICWIVIDLACAAKSTRAYVQSVRGRFIVSAAAGGLGAVILIALFPALLAGPFGQLDPRIVPIWHEQVLELRPLLPKDTESLRDFLFHLGSATMAFLLLVYIAFREPKIANRAGWLMLLLAGGVYFLLSMKHLRFAPFAELMAVPALAELLRRFMGVCREELTGLAEAAGKIFGGFALLLGAMFLAAAIPSKAEKDVAASPHPKECNVAEVAPLLAEPKGLGHRPKIIATFMDYGPDILYRTPHAVIGAPYHRNGDGIWEGYWFLATASAEESRAILQRRKVDLLLACFSVKEARFFTRFVETDNMFRRLDRGELPPWLERMPYDPDTIGGFRIYRVVK